MMKLRLRRAGSPKRPFYRLIVSEKTMQTRGRFVEILGTYDPRKKIKSLNVNWERVDHWIRMGAHPSETLKRILKKGRSTPA